MDYLPAFMRDVMKRARVQPVTPPPPPRQLSIQEKHEAYMKKKEDMEKHGEYLYSREGSEHTVPQHYHNTIETMMNFLEYIETSLHQ